MSIQDSKQYRALEFDGLTHDGPFNEELQWLAIEGQALLAIETQGFWKDTSNQCSSVSYQTELWSSPIPEWDTYNGFVFKTKAKCGRSSESLSAGLLCNQYNPECNGKSAIRIQAKSRGYFKTKKILN